MTIFSPKCPISFFLGIVIYELWSYGLHPFGNDPDLWNFNIKQGNKPDLSQILVPNKKDAADLLGKVLNFQPRQRPTAEEIQKHEYFRRKDVETADMMHDTRPAPVTADVARATTAEAEDVATRVNQQQGMSRDKAVNPSATLMTSNPRQLHTSQSVTDPNNMPTEQVVPFASSKLGYSPFKYVHTGNLRQPQPNLTTRPWSYHERRSQPLAADIALDARPKLLHTASAEDLKARVNNLSIRSPSLKERNPQPSAGPESTQEANNTIIVFDRASKHLQSYDPDKGIWKKIQAMNDDMVKDRWLTAVVLHPHIYVMLGNKYVYRVDQTKLNSGENAPWEPMPDKSFEGRSAAVLNGIIYAAEWEGKRVEKYDPAVDNWAGVEITVNPLWRQLFLNARTVLDGSTLVSAKGNLYFIGGWVHSSFRNVGKFDPTTSEWSNVQPMIHARHGAAAVEFDGKIYVMGGKEKELVWKKRNSVECYDIDLDSWTMVASMNVPRCKFSACVVGGKIFVVGGDERPWMFDVLLPSKRKTFASKNVQLPSILTQDYGNVGS